MKSIAVGLALILATTLVAHASVFDHLMRCDSEAMCRADPTIGKYWTPPSDDDSAGHWRGDVTIPGVGVYAVSGTSINPDTGQIIETRSYFPGWFIVIALPALTPELRDLPNGVCRLIGDRDAATAGQPFIRYVASDITPDQLAIAKVEPTFAGSNYPFGAR